MSGMLDPVTADSPQGRVQSLQLLYFFLFVSSEHRNQSVVGSNDCTDGIQLSAVIYNVRYNVLQSIAHLIFMMGA